MPIGSLDRSKLSTKFRRGLYALVDADAAEKSGLDLVECGRAILGSGVPLVQLRAKDRSTEFFLRSAEALAESRLNSSSLLILNDRADIAELALADGVHVGQDDLSIQDLRIHFPQLLAGVSTHNLAQVQQQAALSPDYLAFGPIFSTQSKRNPEAKVGLAELRNTAKITRELQLPLVAIGGITLSTLEVVAKVADLVAVISLLYPPPNTARPYTWMENRCRELQLQILGWQLEVD